LYPNFEKDFTIPLENGQMNINFFGPPNSFPSLTAAEVLQDNFDPEFFRDKIVLIGSNDIVGGDAYYTPISTRYKMSGVEIQANAIQTILEQKFLSNQSTLSQILTNLVLAAVATLAFMNLGILSSLISLLLMFVLYTASAQLAYYQGLLLNMIQPYLIFLLSFVVCYLYRYFSATKENQGVKNAFAHYLNPALVQELVENPDKLELGGIKKELTIVFTDIENFTSLSEKLTPDALVNIINEYLDAMSSVIMKLGGTVDKFEGDGIMAFFNAPLDQEDHYLQAVEAIFQCRVLITQLNNKWLKEGKPQLNFRAGIATGEAIVGNMGSKERFDYTVMGDTVNTASRLEGVNKIYGTRTIINEACALLVQERFILRELDSVRVKGKKHPVRIFEVIAHREQMSEVLKQMLHCFAQGLKLYREMNFVEAKLSFEKALQIFPADKATKVFVERCEHLVSYPPSEGWDGVFTLSTK
jgi:adenylate cyclase